MKCKDCDAEILIVTTANGVEIELEAERDRRWSIDSMQLKKGTQTVTPHMVHREHECEPEAFQRKFYAGDENKPPVEEVEEEPPTEEAGEEQPTKGGPSKKSKGKGKKNKKSS